MSPQGTMNTRNRNEILKNFLQNKALRKKLEAIGDVNFTVSTKDPLLEAIKKLILCYSNNWSTQRTIREINAVIKEVIDNNAQTE